MAGIEFSEENVSFVKDLYRDMPEMFSEDHMAPLSEELTYTCYRTGTLISISADYYSYLGGAHPNTVYFAWNYDLTVVCSSPSRSWLLIPRPSRWQWRI